MNETIELKTLNKDNCLENDIQEYHEIKQDSTLDDVDTSFSSKQSPKRINEYDFFIQYDVETKSKNQKKKKIKKKEKSSNLMDLINSEIVGASVSIAENVITHVDISKEQQNRYLKTDYTRRFIKSRLIFDAENGWHPNIQTVYLSPIFPKVLENAITENNFIPVEYVNPSSFHDIAVQKCANDQNLPPKFLDVTIENIIFKHHHSFSLEKLLCFKVVEEYQNFEAVQRALKDIIREIKIIRETKNNLNKDLSKVNSSKTETVRFDETVRKYTEKLMQLKEKHTDLLMKKKELTHKIISLWSDIEIVRERSKYVETPYKLELTKRVIDHIQFEKEWKDIFDIEFSDKLDIIEYQYVNEYLQYKEAKNTQKNKLAMKLNKPKLHIDEDLIKQETEAITNNILSKDQIEFVLKRDDTIVSHFVSHYTNNTYHFEIYIDDVFVCESEHYSSNEMFRLQFTESFSVQILSQNTTIKISLFENGNIMTHTKINLVDIKKTISTAEFKVENFTYDNDIPPNAKQVGSGHSIKEIAIANKVRLRSSSLFKKKLYSNCEISIKVGWNDKFDQNRTEAIKFSMETGRQLKRLLIGTDKPTLKELLNIINQIYEKDVNDENVIESLLNMSRLVVTSDDSFPIDDNNPDLLRLKLLHLRNIGGLNIGENKLVPLHATQISTEQMNCLQRNNEKEFDMDYLNDRELDMDPIELQRFIGSIYIQKLNKNMLRILNECLLQKTHKDVVTEFNFSFRNLFSKQPNATKLSMLSTSTKQQLLAEAICKEQEICVTVLRAFNLIDRTTLEDEADDDDKIAGFKTRPLRPFVRINYKGLSVQTVTAIGSHPTWSHTLKLKAKLEPFTSLQIHVFDEYKAQIMDGFSEDDRSNKTVHYRYYNKWLGFLTIPMYTVVSLGSIRGTFKITTPPHLFGYETVPNKDSSSLIPEITQLMRQDTSFISLEITTSLSHLGGLHAYHQPLPNSIEDDYLIKHLNNFVTEYVNQFPTRNIALTFIDSAGRNKCITHFLQPIPLPERDLFPKPPRCESAISKSSGLSKSSSSSGRRDLDIERVSQADRESLYSGTVRGSDNINKMINICLRYVSLIPSYEVSESHVVTLFGIELLKVLHGSPLDHAILLASYFIYLGIKCWVVIGLGLPRGPSSYVLIKYDLTTRRLVLDNEQDYRRRGFLSKGDGYTWYVCDAISGQRHELRDVGCPLKTVQYVFDNENIWVNMQMSQDCESMSFDFSKSSDWQPVFDKTVFVMKQPIITDAALYSPPPNVEGLRLVLETKIKAKIQKWRPHMKTIWNRYCSTLLREMLPQWEYWAFNPNTAKPGFNHRMKQLMVTYKIFGFPLNVPYVSTKSVMSAVKSTGLHITDDPIVEFGLAVEVYAYPNSVLSVWIFIVTITRM